MINAGDALTSSNEGSKFNFNHRFMTPSKIFMFRLVNAVY